MDKNGACAQGKRLFRRFHSFLYRNSEPHTTHRQTHTQTHTHTHTYTHSIKVITTTNKSNKHKTRKWNEKERKGECQSENTHTHTHSHTYTHTDTHKMLAQNIFIENFICFTESCSDVNGTVCHLGGDSNKQCSSGSCLCLSGFHANSAGLCVQGEAFLGSMQIVRVFAYKVRLCFRFSQKFEELNNWK